MNAIDAAGILALSTRLNRLSEKLRQDGTLIYARFGIGFEPKWFPVLFVLHRKEVLGVVEIAQEIGFTHPSAISLLKELEKKDLIQSEKDKADERRRLISLTPKGVDLVKDLQPVWSLMSGVLEEISGNSHHLLKAIEQAEAKIAQQSFYQRAMQQKEAMDNGKV